VPLAVTRQVVRVQLSNGTIVERDPSQLVAVPAGMVLPLADLALEK